MLLAKTPARFVNRLLATLPNKDQQRVLANCEAVELRLAEVLSEPGERIRHVYFPTGSFVSLAVPPGNHAGLEVGLVGNEGMIGTPLMLGAEVTLLRVLVQGAGPAWRMTPERFRDALQQSNALQATLNHYLYVSMDQLAHRVACTHFHTVEARLARWLLMSQDRAHSDRFHATHKSLAFILGVRRVGVTKAASALQQRMLIRYSRGDITVLDRAGLIAAACSCYGATEVLYERILG